jgi:hypothetical protein
MRKLIFLLLTLAVYAVFSPAQTICSSAAKSTSLYCTPIVALQQFSVTPSQTLNVPIPPAFTAVNAEIGTQITQLPSPSPASGFIFSFGTGGLTSKQDLGPIFSERAGTVGRQKLYVAFAYQFFEFDQISNISLKQIPVQFMACAYPTAAGCSPLIETSSRLDLKVHQFTSYLTFGLTNRVDVSVAIPVIDVRMGMSAGCTVCSQTQLPEPNQDAFVLSFNPNQAARSSTGIGDVIFRGKALVVKGEQAGVSLGVDLRVPSGDELNFRGSGTFGVRPFAAVDYRTKILSPHATIGYQINRDSILASQTDIPAHLPNSLTYTAGFDVSVIRPLGLSVDLLGQTFFDSQKVFEAPRAPLNHPDTACTQGASGALCEHETLNTNSLAMGAKYSPTRNFIITGDLLVQLDHNGLHYKPSPMVGISYTF